VTVRAALVVLAVVWLLVLRPLSFGDVVRIAGVTLLVAWALELLQQRPDELADQAPAKPAAP
jgi:Flp pilus assembly protein TadB